MVRLHQPLVDIKVVEEDAVPNSKFFVDVIRFLRGLLETVAFDRSTGCQSTQFYESGARGDRISMVQRGRFDASQRVEYLSSFYQAPLLSDQSGLKHFR